MERRLAKCRKCLSSRYRAPSCRLGTFRRFESQIGPCNPSLITLCILKGPFLCCNFLRAELCIHNLGTFFFVIEKSVKKHVFQLWPPPALLSIPVRCRHPPKPRAMDMERRLTKFKGGSSSRYRATSCRLRHVPTWAKLVRAACGTFRLEPNWSASQFIIKSNPIWLADNWN